MIDRWLEKHELLVIKVGAVLVALAFSACILAT